MTGKTKLEAALACAARNMPVFPCHENSKEPATPNGFYDATCDEVQIIEWWDANPNYNIAFCPADAGLLVVDIDPGADPSFVERLPKTYTVKTPRGGRHFYFKGSGPSTASKLSPHVDTRGIGGYCLLPGSEINGLCYEVERDTGYQPVPDWIAVELKKTHTPMQAPEGFELDHPRNISRAVSYLKHASPAVEYQGSDHATIEIANDLGDLGLSPELAIEILMEHWVPRCEGEWTEDWLTEKVNNAYCYRQNKIGCHAVSEIPEAWNKFAAQQAEKEEAEKPFLYIRDRDAQLNSPPPEMQIETILPARKVIMVTGEKGSGKTYASLEILTAICMNRPAFGKFQVLKPGPVVAFLGEDSREAEHSRLVAIEKHFGRSLQGLFYSVETAIPLDDPNLFEKYHDELQRLQKRIGKIAGMFNDTLKRSLGSLNPNDAETGMLFTSVNEKLAAEFDCSIICNAHPPKNGGGEANIAGTGSFLDNVSVTLNLTRVGEKPFDIRGAFEPKYRIGPRPEPFTVRGVPVQLPSSVAGVTHDLVFTALTHDQIQAANHNEVTRAEFHGLKYALDLRQAHTLPTGLTTSQLAEVIAGNPKSYPDDDAYRQAVGKIYNRLDHGTRSRKLAGGKQSKPKFEGWFERDYRDEPTKGIVKWFCPCPDEQEAPVR